MQRVLLLIKEQIFSNVISRLLKVLWKRYYFKLNKYTRILMKVLNLLLIEWKESNKRSRMFEKLRDKHDEGIDIWFSVPASIDSSFLLLQDTSLLRFCTVAVIWSWSCSERLLRHRALPSPWHILASAKTCSVRLRSFCDSLYSDVDDIKRA